MSHTTEDKRAAARCDGCGNIYTVRVTPKRAITPIGISTGCNGCGGDEFTVLGK